MGALTLAAAVAFGLALEAEVWVGGLERLALWPAYLWLGAAGAALLGAESAPQCSEPAEGSTSSTRTPPASFGWMKLTRLSLVPRLGAS